MNIKDGATKCCDIEVETNEKCQKKWQKREANMLQDIGVNWAVIINLIIDTYLKDFTICVIWHPDIQMNFNSQSSCVFVNIRLKDLRESFDRDVVNFENNRRRYSENGMIYNEETEKLAMSIEKSHCETFLVFNEDISTFIESFKNASQYSVWRSKRNHFIFGISNQTQENTLNKHKFFEDHSNILVIRTDPSTPDVFDLQINKFQGPKRDKQNSLLFVDRFFSSNNSFLYNSSPFPDKVHNLRGREVMLAGFDYKPYLTINYVETAANNSYDLAFGSSSKGSVFVDGTEGRIIMTFCELYNCSIIIDSSEADDWGEVYSNLTGTGSLGMVVEGKAEIAVGAMYSWDNVYTYLDMSMYTVRSGVTCMVPAPKRLVSLLLPLQPFQFTLWMAVLAYLIVETISLCLTRSFESKFVSSSSCCWIQSLRFAFVTTIKLFVSQSGNELAHSWTVRVLLFSCFMNDIIITSIYGGGLASILTVPSYGDAADTIDGMLSHKLQWAANSEAWVSTIRYTDDVRMNGILQNFHLYSDEKLAKLSTTWPEFGFTVERLPFGHFAIADYMNVDHLKIMQEDLYYQYTVAFVPRLWSLLAKFDDLLYWWHSAGLDKYWEWRVVADSMNTKKQKQVESTMYTVTEDGGPVKLGMSNFVGILLIWVLGISMSLLAFVYELISAHMNKKKLY